MNSKRSFITLILTAALILNSVVGVGAQVPPSPPAQPPPAPSAPPAPPAPSAPPAPPAPSAPIYPSSPPPAPSAPPTPSAPPAPTSSPTPSPTVEPSAVPNSSGQPGSGSGQTQPPEATNQPGTPMPGQTTGGQNENGGSGDSSINTGDADASAIITTNANTNSSSGGSQSSDDINVANSGNGQNSANSGDIVIANDASTIQINDADVINDVNLGGISGQNSSSKNAGIDNTITTGDANTTATIINGVNTNLDGVAVIEFNVDETHLGDIILAFPQSTGCTATVCGTNGSLSATNTGNGENSTNDAAISVANDENTFQSNTADVVNNLTLLADSGTNITEDNTEGDNTITTGDANVVATVTNFVNNNIAGAGEVILGVVNIFGDLIGNILLPESSMAGQNGTTAANTGNGAGSVNDANVSNQNTTNTNQTNVANISNQINVVSNTGNNLMEDNTSEFADGTSAIDTGDASLDVNTVTLANTNILDGGTWWLVFVNDADGNWVGQIMGSPDGQTMGGSAGTEFIVNPDGSIIAKNSGNGEGSTNNASVNTSTTNETTQENTANITNNLNLVANTGHNVARDNTGGSNSITTGDSNVVANIMNFVNNNFSGGRVVVTWVNVLGSWLGNFVPPGFEAPAVPTNQNMVALSSNNTDHGSSVNASQNRNTSFVTPKQENQNQVADVLGDESMIVRENGGVGSFTQVFFGQTDETEPPATPGQIIEDNTIIVPKNIRTAGVHTVIPSWFWKIFSGAVLLLIVKKIYKTNQSVRGRVVPTSI